MSTIGLVLALFGAMTIPSRLLGGTLAERFGNRTAAAFGLGAAGVAQLAVAAAHDPRLLFAAILLLGLAYEIVEPATQAVVADDAHADELADLALLWAAVSVAGVLAGVLAALLLPIGVWALFLVDGLGSLLAAGLAWAVLPAKRRADNAALQRNWRHVGTHPLVTWTAVATLHATQIMVIVFMLPTAVAEDGLPPWLAQPSSAPARPPPPGSHQRGTRPPRWPRSACPGAWPRSSRPHSPARCSWSARARSGWLSVHPAWCRPQW